MNIRLGRRATICVGLLAFAMGLLTTAALAAGGFRALFQTFLDPFGTNGFEVAATQAVTDEFGAPRKVDLYRVRAARRPNVADPTKQDIVVVLTVPAAEGGMIAARIIATFDADGDGVIRPDEEDQLIDVRTLADGQITLIGTDDAPPRAGEMPGQASAANEKSPVSARTYKAVLGGTIPQEVDRVVLEWFDRSFNRSTVEVENRAE